MTYERFLKVTLSIKKQDEVTSDLYKQNVDLLDFVDPYHEIISELIKEVYGEEGYDWWSWFCYENDFGEKGLDAFDENENPICYGFESLWEFLEDVKKNNNLKKK